MPHSLPLYIISLPTQVVFEKLATAWTIIETDRQARRDYQQKKLFLLLSTSLLLLELSRFLYARAFPFLPRETLD